MVTLSASAEVPIPPRRTRVDIAMRAGVSERTVYRLCREGHQPFPLLETAIRKAALELGVPLPPARSEGLVSTLDDGAARAALEGLVAVLVPLLAPALARELATCNAPGMLDQSASPLGRRRHIALARKLIAASSADAAQVGRRYLVRREAIEAHAADLSNRAPKARSAPLDELASVRAKYGLTRKVS